MLTYQQLQEMGSHQIIDHGVTIDNRTGINMSNSNEKLRWVAIRGVIDDWAIYIGFATRPIDEIIRSGDKVTGRDNIKRLVPCDTEAYNRYRY